MNGRIKGIIFSILILSLGCSPIITRKSPKLNCPSLSDWPGVYQQNSRFIKSLKSKAMITLESPNFANNFTVDVIFTAPDTLFMQAEGPLGIDLGKFFIGNDRFIIYNQFNNQFLAGSLDEEYYNTFLETNLTLRQLKEAFIGNTILPESIKLIDKNQGIFIALIDSDKWQYKIDPTNCLLKKWEIFQNGQLSLKQEFDNYVSIAGLVLPRKIRITLPQKQEMIAIYHKNIEINQKIDKNSYHIEIGPKTKQLIIAE
jgi:hypothetical protein